MDYVNKLKKDPRILLASLNIIFFLLPWVGVSVEFFGMSESASVSGFRLMGEYLSMILLLLITLFLIAMPFLPVPSLHKFSKLIYLGGSLLAIILTLIATSEASSSYVYRHIGFWFTLLTYLGILVLTFIIDFNINKQSFKEKGAQGVFSDIAGQVTKSAADATSGFSQSRSAKNIVCSSCNATIPAGTKFCPKCGTPVPEAKKCVNCGAELPAGSAFCAVCGTKAE